MSSNKSTEVVVLLFATVIVNLWVLAVFPTGNNMLLRPTVMSSNNALPIPNGRDHVEILYIEFPYNSTIT